MNKIIHTTIFIRPEIYIDSAVVFKAISDGVFDGRFNKIYSMSDVNGSYLEYEQLENPIRESLEDLIDDYKNLFHELDIEIQEFSKCINSSKLEYCWHIGSSLRIIITVRVEKNPFKPEFPKSLKKYISEYLDMRKIWASSANEQGIDFLIDHILVNDYRTKSFCSSLNKFFSLLKKEART